MANDFPEPRHSSVVIGNHAPLRLVLRADDFWESTLAQVNGMSYDYVKLSRLSTFLDVGIAPFSLAIGFDGTLILPATEEYKNPEKALDKLNETLGILLLGGIYSEAIHMDDMSIGRLFFDGYLKGSGRGSGPNVTLHNALRTRSAGPLDSIQLLSPRIIRVHEIEEAYQKGKEVFNKLSGLSPALLLNGMSSYARKQWAEGLIFLWTSIEQVINIIWRQEVLSRVSKDNIDGRTNFLKDFRTWTTSAKIELLYQKEYLGGDEYKLLNIARKARNDFVHNALALGAEKVKAALEVLFRLISLVVSDYKSATEMEAVLTSIHNNQREDLYPKKTVFEPYEVTHWRYLPPLPGDNAWEGDYEIIDELVIHPLKSD